MKFKFILIAVLSCVVLLVSTSAIAAVTYSDWLLQRGFATHGEGVVTWGNTTPVSVIMSSAVAETNGDNTFAIATEVVTLVGEVSAVAGTQDAIRFTIINANATSAVSGTITKTSGDALTLEINAAGSAAQSRTDDWTGITLTAAIASANALTWTEADISVTVEAGPSLPDSSYTDYYEPEAMADIGATAFTVAAGSSKTIGIAMVAGTLYDTAALSFVNKTLAYFETTLEAMYGGSYLEVTIADGLDTDLVNGADDFADKGATDMEAANPLPFTAGTPSLDRLEEDRYTTLGRCVYTYEMGTGGFFEVYDGSTLIWKQVLVDGVANYTAISFEPILIANNGGQLTVRLQGSDTVTAGSLFCLGRTD